MLRRIMRRAMRHAHLLGAQRAADVPAGADAGRARWASAYPELVRAEALIAETLKLEETRFRRRSSAASRCSTRRRARLGDGDTLAGDVAFKLYDTYGFPLDLTQDALRARGIARRRRRLRRGDGAPARRGARGLGGLRRGGDRARLVRAARAASARPSSSATTTETRRGRRSPRSCADGERGRSAARPARRSLIVLNQTPFYARVRRPGRRHRRDRRRRRPARRGHATRRRSVGDLFVHHGEVEDGRRSRSATRSGCSVDHARRARRSAPTTRRRTCCTRRCASVLGDHVAQKGSLVAPDRLRFDFSHPKPIDARASSSAVEDVVNASCCENAAGRRRG